MNIKKIITIFLSLSFLYAGYLCAMEGEVTKDEVEREMRILERKKNEHEKTLKFFEENSIPTGQIKEEICELKGQIQRHRQIFMGLEKLAERKEVSPKEFQAMQLIKQEIERLKGKKWRREQTLQMFKEDGLSIDEIKREIKGIDKLIEEQQGLLEPKQVRPTRPPPRVPEFPAKPKLRKRPEKLIFLDAHLLENEVVENLNPKIATIKEEIKRAQGKRDRKTQTLYFLQEEAQETKEVKKEIEVLSDFIKKHKEKLEIFEKKKKDELEFFRKMRTYAFTDKLITLIDKTGQKVNMVQKIAERESRLLKDMLEEEADEDDESIEVPVPLIPSEMVLQQIAYIMRAAYILEIQDRDQLAIRLADIIFKYVIRDEKELIGLFYAANYLGAENALRAITLCMLLHYPQYLTSDNIFFDQYAVYHNGELDLPRSGLLNAYISHVMKIFPLYLDIVFARDAELNLTKYMSNKELFIEFLHKLEMMDKNRILPRKILYHPKIWREMKDYVGRTYEDFYVNFGTGERKRGPNQIAGFLNILRKVLKEQESLRMLAENWLKSVSKEPR